MPELLLQISIFLLLGKTLLHFCPNKKYERYLKLLFGFMVMVQIMKPLFSFGGMTFGESYEKNLEEFEQMLEASVAQADETWFTYRSQIEQHIEKECTETQLLVQEQLQETLAEKPAEQSSEQTGINRTQEEKICVEIITVEVGSNE